MLELGGLWISVRRIIAVQLVPRTQMGKWGNHVVTEYARVIFAAQTREGKHCRVEVTDPEQVYRLKRWLQDRQDEIMSRAAG